MRYHRGTPGHEDRFGIVYVVLAWRHCRPGLPFCQGESGKISAGPDRPPTWPAPGLAGPGSGPRPAIRSRGRSGTIARRRASHGVIPQMRRAQCHRAPRRPRKPRSCSRQGHSHASNAVSAASKEASDASSQASNVTFEAANASVHASFVTDEASDGTD